MGNEFGKPVGALQVGCGPECHRRLLSRCLKKRSCLGWGLHPRVFLGKVFGSHFFIQRVFPFSEGINCFFDFGKHVEQFVFWGGRWLDNKGLACMMYSTNVLGCTVAQDGSSVYIYNRINHIFGRWVYSRVSFISAGVHFRIQQTHHTNRNDFIQPHRE